MRKPGEIRSLTGLRGVAACYVVLHHYFDDTALPGWAKLALAHGYLSVDLFFVLSGFVISMTYGASFADHVTTRDYAGFLLKRLARIYPLYIVVTLGLAALTYAGIVHPFHQGMPSIPGLLANVLLIQEWGLADSIGGPSWSISTEFAAYLLFPLLFSRLPNRPWAFGVVAAVAAGLLVLVAMQSPAAINQVYDGIAIKNGPLDVVGTGTPYPVLRCLAGFTLGVLSFHLARLPAIESLASRRHAGDFALGAVLVAMAIPGADVAIVLLFVPLIVTLATGNSVAAGVLGGRLAHWLGLISYSIYLIHTPAAYLLQGPLLNLCQSLGLPHAFTLAKLATLALVIPLSAASFYGIERPARIWGRRLGGMRSRSDSYEPSAP